MKIFNNYIIYILIIFIILCIIINNNQTRFIKTNPSNNNQNKLIKNRRSGINNTYKIINKNKNKNIELKGISKFNIYNKSTITDYLNHKLKYIIKLLINNNFIDLVDKYSILDLHYINEQIDKDNNSRYIITFFINYNTIYTNDKVFIDFILLNNNYIHLNKISNNINSYNTLLDSNIDILEVNDSGRYDLYNLTKGKKYINNLNDDLHVINNITPYFETNQKYSSPYFCNRYYHNMWDKYGKVPTDLYNSCYINNRSYDDKLLYPNNYPGYLNNRDKSNDEFNWLTQYIYSIIYYTLIGQQLSIRIYLIKF